MFSHFVGRNCKAFAISWVSIARPRFFVKGFDKFSERLRLFFAFSIEGAFPLAFCSLIERYVSLGFLFFPPNGAFPSMEKTKKHRMGFIRRLRGAPSESRTPDTMIKSHVLYRLSYRHILNYMSAQPARLTCSLWSG